MSRQRGQQPEGGGDPGLLTATTSTQRDTIASTYRNSLAAINTARANLYLATRVDTEAKRKQVAGRSELAAFLGCRAVAAPSLDVVIAFTHSSISARWIFRNGVSVKGADLAARSIALTVVASHT